MELIGPAARPKKEQDVEWHIHAGVPRIVTSSPFADGSRIGSLRESGKVACFWECVCVCASGPLSSSLVFQPWPLKMKEVNSPLVLHLTAFWRVCVDRPNS